MLTRKINENTFLDVWISWEMASPGFSPVHPCDACLEATVELAVPSGWISYQNPETAVFLGLRELSLRGTPAPPLSLMPKMRGAPAPLRSCSSQGRRQGAGMAPVLLQKHEGAFIYPKLPKGLVSKPCLSLAGVFNTLHSAPVWRITRGSGNKTRKWSLKKFLGFWAKLPFLV